MTESETPTNSAMADAWAAAVARAEGEDESAETASAVESAEAAVDAASDESAEGALPAWADVATEPAADEEVVPSWGDEPVNDETVAGESAAAEPVPDESVADEPVPAAPSEDEDEDPVEAFRREMAVAPGDWFVVHSYAGFENRVRSNLESRITTMNMEEQIFQVEVPIEEVTEVKNGVRKQVKRNKFPGYVLVRMDLTDESWGVVRHTPGVTGFVGQGHQPNPLSLDEVVSILAPKPERKPGQAAAAAETRVVDFEVGDPVTIIEGAFGTMQATISEISPESQKVIVMVELFGRETPVELTFAQIEKG